MRGVGARVIPISAIKPGLVLSATGVATQIPHKTVCTTVEIPHQTLCITVEIPCTPDTLYTCGDITPDTLYVQL